MQWFIAGRGIKYLHFQNKQPGETLKKQEQLSCQIEMDYEPLRVVD